MDTVAVRTARRTLYVIGLLALVARMACVDTGGAGRCAFQKPEKIHRLAGDVPALPQHLVPLRDALKTGIASKIDAVLRPMDRAKREDQLIALLEWLPSGSAKDTAMIALGKHGSMRAYAALRRELIRLRWTAEIDLLAISNQIGSAHPDYAGGLVYLWMKTAAFEQVRPRTALESLMLLSGHVPTTIEEPMNGRQIQELVGEYDAYFRENAKLDRSAMVNRRVPELLKIVTNGEESRRRKVAALWILGHYAYWPVRKDAIDSYLRETPAEAVEKQWRKVGDALGQPIRWDYGRGCAKGLESIQNQLLGVDVCVYFY